jgi:hypothetical protein
VKPGHPSAADDPSQDDESTDQGRSLVSITAINDWKELARRERDGLVVSLFWSRTADRVTLVVADQKLDEEFHINVAGAHALDAFYHPFAYAAGRGLGFDSAMCESLVPERSAA